MVTNRQIFMGIAVAIIMAMAVTVCFSLFFGDFGPSSPPDWGWVRVRDVQFEEGYLNVTITNFDDCDYVVNEVIISQGYPSTILTDEIVNTPISGNETISIDINLNWTSRVTYKIHLITTDGNSGTVHSRVP